MCRSPRLRTRPGAGLPAAILAAAAIFAAAPAAAQEEAPADTAVADTVAAPADTTVGELPGELRGVLADTAAGDSSFAVLADPLRPEPERLTGGVISWDRERIRRSSALNLGELLAEMAPGTLLLRAEFFGGPIHLLDGVFGPTAIVVRIDGRPLAPLVGAQPDLSQILIAMADEVRVRRTAAGLQVDVTTLRRTDPRAYSRVEAGSGDPGLETLRLVFTNGLGRSFAATAGYELLDSSDPESDLQGFSGGFAWLPGGGTSGLEVQYEQRSFDRTVGQAQSGSRSRLVLGGRVGLAEQVQLGAWIGESTWELDAPEPADPAAATTASSVDATQAGVELRGVWERAWATAGARLADATSLPDFELELEGGADLTRWLTLDGAARVGTWEEFDTREGRIGAQARLLVARLDVRPYLLVGGGVRGASYLAADEVVADSVEFSAVAAGLDLSLGAFAAGGRVARQRVDRQPAFGSGFDSPLLTWPEAEVTSFEATLDVPVLPLSWLLEDFDPVRLRGFVRHNRVETATTPLFVPTNAVRGELYFEDSFLENDLGVRLALGLDRRDPWLAPPPAGQPGDAAVAVPARTSFDFDLGLRIVTAVIYWRYDNLDGRLQQDLPGFEFPAYRQVFGVRWAFYD